jgi:hypothetical protein
LQILLLPPELLILLASLLLLLLLDLILDLLEVPLLLLDLVFVGCESQDHGGCTRLLLLRWLIWLGLV